MLKKYTTLLFLGIITIFFVKCKSDKDDRVVTQQQDTLDLPIKEKEYPITSEYTKIVDGMCDNKEFTDLKYTNLNTIVYPIFPDDSTKQFIFASEVDCGYTPGNCGKRVHLIRRVSANKYVSDLSFCGLIDSIAVDHPAMEQHIYYSTPLGRNFLVKWKGTIAKAEQLSYHGMPIRDLADIEAKTGLLYENFIKKGDTTQNLDAVAIEYQLLQLDSKNKLHIYQFDALDKHYAFAYINSINQVKPSIGGIGQLIVKNKSAANITFEYTPADSITQYWSYNSAKKQFVKK